MGTIKTPCLTASQIIDGYVAGGATLRTLSLYARKPEYWVRDVLVRNGVRIRSREEALRLSIETRARNKRRNSEP